MKKLHKILKKDKLTRRLKRLKSIQGKLFKYAQLNKEGDNES